MSDEDRMDEARTYRALFERAGKLIQALKEEVAPKQMQRRMDAQGYEHSSWVVTRFAAAISSAP